MTDLDVNDDGRIDAILPTRACSQALVTPPRQHGPHLNFELPPNVTRCPGYPDPQEEPCDAPSPPS